MNTKSIIMDLFNGDYSGISKPPPETARYHKSVADLKGFEDKLLKTLSDEQQKLFYSFYEAVQIRDGEISDQHFKEGFSLAINIIIDAISTN